MQTPYQMDSQKIVLFALEGGPNTGKSSLVEALRLRGYEVANEAAAEIISEGTEPMVNGVLSIEFQRKLLARKLQKEAEIRSRPGRRERFLDRGLLDSRAYYLYHGQELPDFLKGLTVDYAIVFVLDPVDKWDENGIRKEPEKLEFTKKLNPLCIRVYEEAGCKVVRVALMPKFEQRVEFVLQKIQEHMAQVGASTSPEPVH